MKTLKYTVTVVCSMAFLALAVPASAGPLAACKADAARICPGSKGAESAKCLKEHENDVSIGCAKELKKIKAEMGK